MKTKAAMLASAAAAGILVVILTSSGGDTSPQPAERAPVAESPPAARECRERVEGHKIVPNQTVDTVIGPMAFIRLPTVYRDYASRRNSELVPDPDGRMPSMKSIGVLRAGARVTLEVPRRQRRWMEVIYDYPHHRGGHAITLRACKTLRSPRARRRECGWRPDLACRWRYTQFNGGFGIDFANAPRRGLCAELIVRTKGKGKPLRELLFDPEPGACDQHTE